MRNCIEYNVDLDLFMVLGSIADNSDENCILFHCNSESLTVSIQENDSTTTTVINVENGVGMCMLDMETLRRVSTIYVWVTHGSGASTTPIQIITESEIPETSHILMRLVNGIIYCRGEVHNVVNPDNLPIATTTSLGVVAVGDNLDVTKEGMLSARASAPERMTNAEIDAICV